MKKRLKLVAIQFLVTITILATLEFVLAGVMDVRNSLKRTKIPEVHAYIPTLPNYSEIPWAVQYWEENWKQALDYKSFVGWRYAHFEGETINIDSLGFRKSAQSKSIDENSALAFFLGGSTMWGVGSNDLTTIPSIFGQNQSKYKVKNLGQIAYSAYQGFLELRYHIYGGEIPDLVVSYDGVNDSPLSHGFYEHMLEDQYREWLRERETEKEYYSLPVIRTMAKRISGALGLKEKVDDSDNEIDGFPTIEQDRASASQLLDSWLSMMELCDRVGARFICILQPNAFVGEPDISNVLEYGEEHWHFDKNNGYAYYKEVLRLLEEPQYIDLKPHFLDYTQVLNGMSNTYLDYCHLSPNGNEKISELIIQAAFREK